MPIMLSSPPDSQLSPGIDLVSVVKAGMIQVMADAGRQQDAEVKLGQNHIQLAAVD